MKGRLLPSVLLSVSLLLAGCEQEEAVMDYSEFYREMDTEGLHFATEPLLVQEEVVTVLDGLFTVRLYRESYRTIYFAVQINKEWGIYTDCSLTATWVTALGEDAEGCMAEFYCMAGNTEYIVEVPRSSYRYIRFDFDAQPAKVFANAIHSSVGLGETFSLKGQGICLKAERVAKSVVGFSGLGYGLGVYVDFIRDGVVVDHGFVENGDYQTKYGIDSICYFVIERGDGLADGGK